MRKLKGRRIEIIKAHEKRGGHITRDNGEVRRGRKVTVKNRSILISEEGGKGLRV